jgi:hypothetical protein
MTEHVSECKKGSYSRLIFEIGLPVFSLYTKCDTYIEAVQHARHTSISSADKPHPLVLCTAFGNVMFSYIYISSCSIITFGCINAFQWHSS